MKRLVAMQISVEPRLNRTPDDRTVGFHNGLTGVYYKGSTGVGVVNSALTY